MFVCALLGLLSFMWVPFRSGYCRLLYDPGQRLVFGVAPAKAYYEAVAHCCLLG